MGIDTGNERQRAILKFWFGELNKMEAPPEEISSSWWARDGKADEYIRGAFGSDLMEAKEGRLGSFGAYNIARSVLAEYIQGDARSFLSGCACALHI